MNLLFQPLLIPDYPGYFPDFGILDFIHYSYTDIEVSNAHAAWDGFCVIMIPVLGVIGWRLFKKWVIIYKKWKVNRLVDHFAEKDPMWDRNSMKDMARELFYEVQTAWFNNSFKSLAPLLTDKIKLEWQETWKQMRLNHYTFVVGQIDVRSVSIIAVEDHLDDNRDKFKVEISGYIKRYVKNKPDTTMYMRSSSDYEEFTDIYSFVRNDDKWLLDDIHHGAKVMDVLNLKNQHIE